MSMTLAIEQSTNQLQEHRTVIPVIDMHLHFVDFMQGSDLFHAQSASKGLIESMKEGNISKNVVFGLPVKKKWEYFENLEPFYYLDDNSRCTYYTSTDEIVAWNYSKLLDCDKACIAPTLVGFDPTDKSAIDYVRYMFDKYPFWKGIGEVLLRHDDLTNLTIGEVARANHPAMDPIYDFCREKNIPICLHQNSTSVASSIKSISPKGYTYLHELIEVLKKHKDTKIIWAHCGISRRVDHKNYHVMVSKMLKKYKNLYVDFSWVAYDNVICEKRNHPTDPLIPKKEWIDEVILPEKNRERIMLGSDLCGHFSTKKAPFQHGKTMARYNNLLIELQKYGVDRMVAYENAYQLYFR